MSVRVRKLQNVSDSEIPVQVNPATTIYLSAGGTLEDMDVHNLASIREFVKVEQDLSEIDPIREGKTLLFD
jgi:hypothetical protein